MEQCRCMYFDVCTFNYFRLVVRYNVVSIHSSVFTIFSKVHDGPKISQKLQVLFFYIETTDAKYSNFNRHCN